MALWFAVEDHWRRVTDLGRYAASHSTTNTHHEKKTISLLLACAVALVITGCTTPHHSTSWEYKTVSSRLDYSQTPQALNAQTQLTLAQKINQAAADGWEVVSAGSEDGYPFAILRKAK